MKDKGRVNQNFLYLKHFFEMLAKKSYIVPPYPIPLSLENLVSTTKILGFFLESIVKFNKLLINAGTSAFHSSLIFIMTTFTNYQKLWAKK